MARTDKVTAIVIAMCTIVYLIGARSLKFLEEFGPGPGFFPVLLGLTMLCLCIAYYFLTVKSADSLQPEPFKKADLLRPAGIVTVLVVAALVLEYLGFLITVFLLVLALLIIFERYNAVRGIVLALAISAGFYLLFNTWLRVSLPQGILKSLPF